MKAEELVKRTISGIIEAIIIILIYLYLFPLVLNKLYSTFGYSYSLFGPSKNVYLAALIIIVGLGITSKILRGSILSPVLRAAANMIGIIYVLSLMGNGVITVEGLQSGGYTLDVTFDLSPIMIIFFAFFAVPGVIMPFITYYYSEEIEEL